MRSTVGKLAKLSAIYMLGDVVSRAAAFLLLPLYTHYLTPAEYGVVAITEMIRQVLLILLSFGTMSAILRFYYQLKSDAERKQFYGTMWVFLIIVPAIIITPISLWGEPLFHRLFATIDFKTYIRPMLWSSYLGIAFSLLPPYLFRAREQATQYVAFNLAAFGLTACGTIWFVVVQGRGSAGYLLGQLIAAAALAGISALILLREVRLSLNLSLLRSMLRYSLPLIPHFLSHWVLSLSDRAILERFVPLADIGIYTLAYQFGLAYYMLISSANNALFPAFGRAADDREARAALPRLTTYYVLLITTVGLGLGLGGGHGVLLLTAPEYAQAAAIVPLIILGYFAAGLYQIPLSAIMLIAGKTWAIPLVTASAAALNIALNLLIVPRYGIYGAALSTVAGYAGLAIGMFLLAHVQQPIRYEYGRLGRIAIVAAIICGLGAMAVALPPLPGLICDLALILALPLLLAALGFWDADERHWLHMLFRRLFVRLIPTE